VLTETDQVISKLIFFGHQSPERVGRQIDFAHDTNAETRQDDTDDSDELEDNTDDYCVSQGNRRTVDLPLPLSHHQHSLKEVAGWLAAG
jgi:hypothetical protein